MGRLGRLFCVIRKNQQNQQENLIPQRIRETTEILFLVSQSKAHITTNRNMEHTICIRMGSRACCLAQTPTKYFATQVLNSTVECSANGRNPIVDVFSLLLALRIPPTEPKWNIFQITRAECFRAFLNSVFRWPICLSLIEKPISNRSHMLRFFCYKYFFHIYIRNSGFVDKVRPEIASHRFTSLTWFTMWFGGKLCTSEIGTGPAYNGLLEKKIRLIPIWNVTQMNGTSVWDWNGMDEIGYFDIIIGVRNIYGKWCAAPVLVFHHICDDRPWKRN